MCGNNKDCKECMMLSNYRRFIGSDPVCFNTSVSMDVEKFVRQVWNRELDIMGIAEVMQAAERHVMTIDRINWLKRDILSNTPA